MAVQMPPILGDFYTKSASKVTKRRRKVYLEFVEKCESDSKMLAYFAGSAGLAGAAFERSASLRDGNVVFDRFHEACRKLPGEAQLTIAFHGTPEANVAPILEHGLDPKKRSLQAYGPGEYFSTDPGVSTGYCRGGTQLLVFLVVRPLVGAGSRSCPHNYIVVPTAEHQLPLGVLKFEYVEAAALSRAHDMRRKLQLLNQQILDKESEASVARIKARVIQKLITAGLDEAGEMYVRNSGHLDDKAKKEISAFAHLKYDQDFVVIYFPDLPPPSPSPVPDELEGVTVEALECELESKKKELAEEVAKLKTGV